MRLSRKKHLALLLLCVLASLVGAETSLRLVKLPGRIKSGWSWEDSPRRHLANYREDQANELGFRGQPISYGPRDYVVLLLGDSQVEAATSAPELMPEQLLQRHLEQSLKRPVKVFSLAASGFGQDQQLIALERYYLTHRADLVLVWASPDNDFSENAFPDLSSTSTAGHLKPTFRLVQDELRGPYYDADFYLYHSALLQLAFKSYADLNGVSLEQLVLDRWVKGLPPSHEALNDVNLKVTCGGLIALGQKEYAENRFELNPNWRFLLLSSEDYFHSRSQYSPFLVHRSPRDTYLVEITRKLYQRIGATAKGHNSRFNVFYPAPADGAHSDQVLVKCVQNLWEGRPAREVLKDESALLRETVAAQDLILVELPGGKELNVSSKDRHLSDLGNDRAMQQLAPLLLP